MTGAMRLTGQRILIVEDDGFVAADATAALENASADVIAAPRIREAIDVATHVDLAAALLDINLNGAECTPVCKILDRRKVPFAFCTGYHHSHVMDRWPQAPVLHKPVTPEDLFDCVAGLAQPLQPA